MNNKRDIFASVFVERFGSIATTLKNAKKRFLSEPMGRLSSESSRSSVFDRPMAADFPGPADRVGGLI